MEQQNDVKKELTPPIKKVSYIKKIFKGILFFIMGIILLNILLYVIISIPFVQQKVLDFAVNKIKEITKTEVRIDEIQLSLLSNVNLKGIYIEDQKKDTLIYAQNLDVSINPWKLLNNKLLFKGIELDDFTLNVSQEKPESDYNFQFLIDAFSSSDTTSVDTTSSSLSIDIENINLSNGNLKYNILSEPITPNEFNPSHIQISNLNAKVQLPSIDIMKLDARLISLSLKEHSGLEVKNLKGTVTSEKTTFFAKDLELELPHSNLKIPSASYNLLTSAFEIKSDQATISPKDLLSFLPSLKYLKDDIQLKTTINGKLPTIKIDTLQLVYGNEALINASASISDYSNYGEADLNLSIHNFMISPSGITDFAMLGDSAFVTPDILKTLGDIRLEGDLSGKFSNLQVKAEAWAKQGSIIMLATGAIDTTFEKYKTNIKLQTQNFNLGALLEDSVMGRISANIELIASQNPKQSLVADLKGQINSIVYNKQDFKNIPFTAYYNAEKMGLWLDANLPEGAIEAKVDMTQENIPKVTLDAMIKQVQLDKFAEFPDWKNPRLTLGIKGDIIGLDINTLKADLEIDNFVFSHDSLSLYPGKMTLNIGANSPDDKYINLNSSFFQAQIKGKYDFISLSNELNNILNEYLPGIFEKTTKKIKPGENNFNFNILVQNTEEIEKVFDLPIQIGQPIVLSGIVNTTDNELKASVNIPTVKFGDSEIVNGVINLFNTDSIFSLRGDTRIKQATKELVVNLDSDVKSDTINTTLSVKSDSTDLNINGTLNALAHFDKKKKGDLISTIQFTPTFINIGSLNLNFMPAKIVNEDERTSISNFGFFVGKGRMFSRFLGLDGVISAQQQDTLNINFTNAQFGDLLKAFDINNVTTEVNGDIKLVNILDKPEMYTRNFSLSDIIIFNDTLGDFKVSSYWSDTAGAIRFFSTLDKQGVNHSTAKGLVYPDQDSLNLKINLNKFSLNWVEPFMDGLLNRLDGTISSELTATGKITTPDIQGWLGVNDVYLGVDYTNVTYHISDTIRITPDKIGFDNLVVQDKYNNTAMVNALVTHKNFNDIHYNLDVAMNNLMVLNTQNRTDSLFYGKIFASGTGNIKGTESGMNIKMNIRNGKNSNINVQIPQTSDASEYQGIVYINTPAKASEEISITEESLPFPLKLAVDLNVNNNINLGVIINPLTGDNMQIEGSGLIKFTYDMSSEAMNAFGNYIISNGKVKLRLQNISTMEFIIENGSKLIMNGDPLRTEFNIIAYKRVRADLSTLNDSFTTGNNASKVNVDCVLGISGNMDKMNLTYDIRLPDAPEDVQQKLNSLISTSEQKTLQFAYLLATGSFHGDNSSGKGGNMAGGMLTSIASSTLSSGLNALFGNILGSKWQIGSNISSNDGTFSDMDMSVSVSRTFLDDKLKFNTNLGYRTDQTLATENAFIGDFEVEYALTRSVTLKAFNKTNNQFYKQAPTTQGVGVVYTKEAKNLKDLFKIFRKKRKRVKREQTETK